MRHDDALIRQRPRFVIDARADGPSELVMTGVGTPGAPLEEVPLNAKKEHFSLSFVRMVVYAAGFSVKSHETDFDGVDITIVSSAEYEAFYCPEFELQLKCTSQAHLLTDEHMRWSMEAGPFRRLTNPKRFTPAYLGVLLVPEEGRLWVEQDETHLLTKSRLYWQAAKELGRIKDDGVTKTVYLPRSNLFDVPQLQGILKTIGEEGR